MTQEARLALISSGATQLLLTLTCCYLEYPPLRSLGPEDDGGLPSIEFHQRMLAK